MEGGEGNRYAQEEMDGMKEVQELEEDSKRRWEKKEVKKKKNMSVRNSLRQ